MKKYKCLDPNCGHTWDLDSDPFECPACNGTNFVEIRKPRWFKYLLTIGGILIAFILLLQLCSDGKTTVKTDANILQCKLTVTIDGDHKNDYKIILRKGGVVHGDHSKKAKAVFNELEGTYSLDVQFIGKGKMPKINSFKRTFTFTKPPKAPEAPQITILTKTPDKLTNTVKVYTVTITTDAGIVPLRETEFSKDGVQWQSSNVCKSLLPGTYTFYARNVQDKSLQDQKILVLDPFVPAPPPTIAQLNALLNQIATCDDMATDSIRKLLGSNLPVKGIANISNVQQLVIDACVNGIHYQVTGISENHNRDVVSITVK